MTSQGTISHHVPNTMSGRPVLVLSGSDVRNILSHISVPQLLETVHTALRASSSPTGMAAQMPHRTSVQSDSHKVLFMPARIESIPTTAIKVVAVPRHASKVGLPATTLVMDEETGTLDAVVNSRTLTALRTAAGMLFPVEHCIRYLTLSI